MQSKLKNTYYIDTKGIKSKDDEHYHHLSCYLYKF